MQGCVNRVPGQVLVLLTELFLVLGICGISSSFYTSRSAGPQIVAWFHVSFLFRSFQLVQVRQPCQHDLLVRLFDFARQEHFV
jgi:hypothetical protein